MKRSRRSSPPPRSWQPAGGSLLCFRTSVVTLLLASPSSDVRRGKPRTDGGCPTAAQLSFTRSQQKSSRHADMMQKRRACVFTCVRDEPFFLPLWHRYYSRHFQSEDMHLLHHVTSEVEHPDVAFGSALKLFDDNNVTTLVHAEYCPEWMRTVVSAKLSSLLETYEAVLFAEVDELVCTVPASHHPSLASYVQAFLDTTKSPAVRCVGYEVHHDFSCEPPLDTALPVLAQRTRWHRNTLYDKALLTRGPLHWSLGFHTCDEEPPQDADLYLVHLHKIDFQAYLTRHEKRSQWKHAAEAIANGWNEHFRKQGAALMGQYMNLPSPLEEIPEWVQVALSEI